ncbi:MAG TPA: ATP phosphoribosyltransferase regulatory subunit [Bacteroidota bacterium]|nr:ATP phosphoribosyltransferase regulatory subunit [Bacteroidota bacterium]
MGERSIGLPAGFRDIVFDTAERRRRIEGEFAAVLNDAAYREVVPSMVEYLDLYARGNQGVRERALRFLDRDDALLALRADFTPAVARIVAGRLPDLHLPVRLWYSGPVFRKTGRHSAQYRELAQIGAELVGGLPPEADAEILDVALECLARAGFTDASVHVNHAGIFRGLVDSLGLEPGRLAEIRSAIDRKDMRALDVRLEELGVHGGVRSQVGALSRCVGDERALEEAAGSLVNEESRSAIASLERLASALPRWKDRIVYDLTEIDEMEYYTGIMFTFLSPRHSAELGRGGRYDTLMREFGADLPAVGFSFSMDALGECA